MISIRPGRVHTSVISRVDKVRIMINIIVFVVNDNSFWIVFVFRGGGDGVQIKRLNNPLTCMTDYTDYTSIIKKNLQIKIK